jgi:ribosome-associated toxin RatA of RatAB toxin-antitoxin module
MAGASKTIEINAPIEKVFAVITDYEKYPEFLDEQTGAKVLSKNDNVAEVSFKLKVVKEIEYRLRIVESSPTGIQWTLIKGEMMKENNGGWKLEPNGDKTKATYSIELGLGLLVPKSVATMLAETTLPKTLEAFKRRIEST